MTIDEMEAYLTRGDFRVNGDEGSNGRFCWIEGAPGFPDPRPGDSPTDRLCICDQTTVLDQPLCEAILERICAALELTRGIPTADLVRLAEKERSDR